MTWRRYFAYGSNMLVARLRERTPSARLVGAASLAGHSLHFHHVSRQDGTAKCNIAACEGEVVHGVVYDVHASEQPVLDRAEDLGRGYHIEERQVLLGADSVSVFCYVAVPGTIDDNRQPFRWYRDIVLAGAQEHGFPSGYVARIAREPVIEDPDAERAARHAALLAAAD
ncbi:gamma-glutamylcyclotransferase family protein [Aquisalimonas lutea]|uniref:gamma-glutamylcyclotransferase family protein n=1 Tax=Aquisalimonas lutea TaxID=1327750 RepID=UPI0025B55822|nr:gamma-glutamylcyclotransferase family protein [Aquisalimonas lutea]MDN3516998.1 gamma-glutamylcyclotransferase family protein [Aquisalimonas lutea]